jgi:DNA-binding NarL/FixJ family response regulator
MEAGARGYILKDAVDLDLGMAIRRVAAGDRVFAPQLFQKAGDSVARRDLSARELEVLQLIVNANRIRRLQISSA